MVYPVLVRFVFGICSSSNSTTCSCFGDPRLISLPITSYADAAASRTPVANRSSSCSRYGRSTAIPSRSIAAITSISGSSTSASNAVPACFSSSASRVSARSAIARARSIVASAAGPPSTSSKLS